jgi:hypothetical protein
MALRGDGRERRVACRRSGLFERGLCRRDPGVDLQFARQRDPRHRQHGGAGDCHLHRRRGAHPPIPLSHLRMGTVPAPRHRRRRRGGGRLYGLGSIALAAYLCSERSIIHLRLRGAEFRWPLFRDILRVGTVAALVTVQTNLTIAITTGLVGSFGPAARHGHGQQCRRGSAGAVSERLRRVSAARGEGGERVSERQKRAHRDRRAAGHRRPYAPTSPVRGVAVRVDRPQSGHGYERGTALMFWHAPPSRHRANRNSIASPL